MDGILPTHLSEIYEALKSSGLDPDDFTGENKSVNKFLITHKASGHHFLLHRSDHKFTQYSGYYTTFTPKQNHHPLELKNDLNKIKTILLHWLNTVIKRAILEINTPNPWISLRGEYNHFEINDKEPFSTLEIDLLAPYFDKLPELLIQSFNIQYNQVEEFKESMTEELSEIKKRIDQKESKGIIRKLFTGIIIEQLLKYASERVALNSVLTLISNFFSTELKSLPDNADKLPT